ncbi:hypothetical protein [Micromonospora sp. NPDC005171]|uniref:hypothetical protein n=1 Tax=Micromonospora sp. NPDC005171 TaxID=3156866 RepID=UPI0033B826BA
MKPSRLASAMLILAVTTALAACGDGDKATTAGSTTPAPTSAAPSAVATSAAATPSPAAGTATDKQLCEAVKKASDEMRAEMVKVVTTGDASAADFKKILTGLEVKVTTVASTGDGKLAEALRTFGAEAAKAAAAADPATAADNPAFEKAGKDVSAVCKANGINIVL